MAAIRNIAAQSLRDDPDIYEYRYDGMDEEIEVLAADTPNTSNNNEEENMDEDNMANRAERGEVDVVDASFEYDPDWDLGSSNAYQVSISIPQYNRLENSDLWGPI